MARLTRTGVRPVSPERLAGAVGDPQARLHIESVHRLDLSSQWQIAPGTISSHAIHLFLSGQARGRVGRQELTVRPGTLFWIGPGVERHAQPIGSDPLAVYHLRFDLDRQRERLGLRGGLVLAPDAWACRAAFDRLLDAHRGAAGHPDQPYHDLRRRAALMDLLAQALTCAAAPPTSGPVLDEHQRRACWNYLQRHAAHRPEPADLARAVGLSHDHFTRCFRRSFGCPPRTWILQERIRMVATHLREDPAPIHLIAAASGFDDAPRFSRQFRQVMGCSPSAWRRGP